MTCTQSLSAFNFLFVTVIKILYTLLDKIHDHGKRVKFVFLILTALAEAIKSAPVRRGIINKLNVFLGILPDMLSFINVWLGLLSIYGFSRV